MRGFLLAMLAACSYNPGPAADDDDDPAPGPDAGAEVVPGCREPGTVLCLEFEDEPAGQAMNLALDGSGFEHHAEARDVSLTDATVASDPVGVRAAFFEPLAAPQLRIPASPRLDLRDGFTLEMWVVRNFDVPEGFRYWLVDHAGQYALSIGDDQELRCGVEGDVNVRSADDVPVGDGRWHHVACTYDPAGGGTLRVFVDGAVAGCRGDVGAVASVAADTMIGARTNATSNERYYGLLDSVHVHPRALAPDQICRLANGMDCDAMCPTQGGGGGGDGEGGD